MSTDAAPCHSLTTSGQQWVASFSLEVRALACPVAMLAFLPHGYGAPFVHRLAAWASELKASAGYVQQALEEEAPPSSRGLQRTASCTLRFSWS